MARAVKAVGVPPLSTSSPKVLPEVNTRPFPPTTPRSTMKSFVDRAPALTIVSPCGKVSDLSFSATSTMKLSGAP